MANVVDDFSSEMIEQLVSDAGGGRVQYADSDGKWEVGLNVSNLTDEEALTYTYDIVGYTIQVFAPPRRVSS